MTDKVPPLAHTVDPFPGAEVETFPSWWEAFGAKEAEWRNRWANLEELADKWDEACFAPGSIKDQMRTELRDALTEGNA